MTAHEYAFFAVLGLTMTWATWHLISQFLKEPKR